MGEYKTTDSASPADECLDILIAKLKQFDNSGHGQTGILSCRVVVNPIDRNVQPFRDFLGLEKLWFRFHRVVFRTGLLLAVLNRGVCADSILICKAFGVLAPKV